MMTTALWCVLFAGILPVITTGIAKWGPGLDNRHPRDWAGGLTGYRRRAYAAHQNGFEAFPFFAVAVLCALQAGAPQGVVNALAVVVVAARVGYVAAYLADRPTLRSVLWGVGWFGSIAIFASPAWAT